MDLPHVVLSDGHFFSLYSLAFLYLVLSCECVPNLAAIIKTMSQSVFKSTLEVCYVPCFSETHLV
jgi:hypothetical protein